MGYTTVEGAIRHLEEFDELINDPSSPIFKDISTLLQISLNTNFLDSGRPAWPERKGDYDWPILIKTGFLADSTDASLNHWEHSGDTHTIEAWSPYYGYVHQYGKGEQEERKYMQLTDEERQEILNSISQIIRETIW